MKHTPEAPGPSVIWLLGLAQVDWIRSLKQQGQTTEEALEVIMEHMTPRARRNIETHRTRIIEFFVSEVGRDEPS